jgi:HEAT repeat protein
MLVDLMALQHDVRRWRELADLAVSRIDMLVTVGDFPSATSLVGAMGHQARHHDDPAVQTAAGALLDHILNASMMRHVAAHLDTIDKDTVAAAKRFCHALGTSIVGPLAEVLSREERTRARQHLIEILLGLGSSGRQSVERLKQSPNAAVRRTAVLLLREFGGSDALLDLESLLNDAEPQVQRDATRAIAMMNSEAAFVTLTRALTTGTEHARAVMTGVLSSIPNDEALPVLAYLVRSAPCRGPMWQVYERAVQRLSAIGGRTAVEALVEVMNKRVVWAPFKIAVLRRLAADAIARIGTPDALDALRVAAREGARGARSAARRHLAALESPNRR